MVNMGEIRTYARGGSYGVLGLLGVGVFTNLTTFNPINFFICLVYVLLIGILEVPFLCTCMSACQRVSMKLEIFENYMLRGGLYTVLGVLGMLVVDLGLSIITLGMVGLVVDGVLYLAGYARGEKGVEAPSKYNPQVEIGVSTSFER